MLQWDLTAPRNGMQFMGNQHYHVLIANQDAAKGSRDRSCSLYMSILYSWAGPVCYSYIYVHWITWLPLPCQMEGRHRWACRDQDWNDWESQMAWAGHKFTLASFSLHPRADQNTATRNGDRRCSRSHRMLLSQPGVFLAKYVPPYGID